MTSLSVEKIVAIEGIVIRRIQTLKREVWRGKEGQSIIYKSNDLGGKYLITFDISQYSNVHFSIKRDGMGDTIQEAFYNYLENNQPFSKLHP